MIKTNRHSNRNTKTGVFTPSNPEKYIGTFPITYMSSWEHRIMQYFDNSPNILKWGSESVVIKYMILSEDGKNVLDAKQRNYYTDFNIIYNKGGEHRKAVLEIKPHIQTLPPKKTKRNTSYQKQYEEYLVNLSKWKFAKEWCNQNGIDFFVLTEYDLGIKPIPKKNK